MCNHAWVLSKNANKDWPHLFNFKLNIALCLIKGAAMPERMTRCDLLKLVPVLPQSTCNPLQDKVVPDDVRLDGMHHYSRCVAKLLKGAKPTVLAGQNIIASSAKCTYVASVLMYYVRIDVLVVLFLVDIYILF